MIVRPLIRIVFALAGCVFFQAAAAQSLARGELIISTATLEGTMFEETIMLLVHHDNDGSIGIMINRPTNLAPAQVYPDIAGAVSYEGVLFFGGPLASNRPFLLSRRSNAIRDASIRIVEDVYLSGDASLLNALGVAERTDAFSRIYAGSAQWGPGQLRNEVESGAWITLRADAGLVFAGDPEALWEELINAARGSEVVRTADDSQATDQAALSGP